MPDIRVDRLTVPRTARYAAFGPPPAEAAEWWFVLHGYGQQAADFLATCAALDDGHRLVVAPEALSRFYNAGNGSMANATVGASWMTREDRDHEIADYLRYLDTLLGALTGGRPAAPPVHVLGFSQGTATASRWVAAGRVQAARLVAWGGVIAPELDLRSPDAPLRRTRVQLVVGSRDQFATEERIAAERARLDEAGLEYEAISFNGGHRLDNATLAHLAAS